jgi:trehalose-6-phosphatase
MDAELVPRRMSGKGRPCGGCWPTRDFETPSRVYFGDDLSDEAAFAAVRDGVAIVVGSKGPTQAHYAIPERARLTTALQTLLAALPESA